MATDIASIKRGADQKSEAAEKAVKVKLTKEQAAYVKEFVKLENRIAVCREYIVLWGKFFQFFADDLSQKEISATDEKAFFQIMSQLARKQFAFQEAMGDTFDRGKDIIEVLCLAVSLANIQVMPENTRSKIELDWHGLFLDINKSQGRLLRMLPGNPSINQALEQLKQTNSNGGANANANNKPKTPPAGKKKRWWKPF